MLNYKNYEKKYILFNIYIQWITEPLWKKLKMS